MKKIISYLFTMLLFLGLSSCKGDDPIVKNDSVPPVISGEAGDTYEVLKDEADYFLLSRTITSEKGLASITLKQFDVTVNTKTTFENNKEDKYSYKIDLSGVTQTSSLSYTIEAKDLNGKVTVQDFTIIVRKGSELGLTFASENELKTSFEECLLKFTIVRGVAALSKVDVLVNNSSVVVFNMADSVVQRNYVMGLMINGLAVGNTETQVVITDVKGAQFKYNKTIIREKASTWQDLQFPGACMTYWRDTEYEVPSIPPTLTCFTTIQINKRVHIDDSDQLPDFENPTKLRRLQFNTVPTDGGDQEAYVYLDFKYNAAGMVNKMIYSSYHIDMTTFAPKLAIRKEWIYSYDVNNNKQVTKVSYKPSETAVATDYLTDFVYQAGELKSWKINGVLYTPQYADKGGERVRIDHMQGDKATGKTYDFTTKQINPLYLSALPPVVPFGISGEGLNPEDYLALSQWVYNKFYFDKINGGESLNFGIQPLRKKVTNVVEGSAAAKDAPWLGKAGYYFQWSQEIVWSQAGLSKKMIYSYKVKDEEKFVGVYQE